MKDLEKLRKILSDEGWELLNISAEENSKYIVIAKEKDIWDGVEFVEVSGNIRKIEKASSDFFHFTIGSHARKENCQPSTEGKYVNQLAYEAKDNFSNLDLNLIDNSMIKGGDLEDNLTVFKYRKDTDTLYYYGKPIYQNGIWAKKKYIWDGIEYAESLYDSGHKIKQFTKGKIYKIDWINLETLRVIADDNSNKNGMHKNSFKPSTEQAYFEQLEKEAFEKYGAIQEGDKFEVNVSGESETITAQNITPFYDSENDCLNINGIIVYSKGLWVAKRVEGTEVNLKDWGWKNDGDNGIDFDFKFNVPNGGKNISVVKLAEYLCKHLEEYLNKESNAD